MSTTKIISLPSTDFNWHWAEKGRLSIEHGKVVQNPAEMTQSRARWAECPLPPPEPVLTLTIVNSQTMWTVSSVTPQQKNVHPKCHILLFSLDCFRIFFTSFSVLLFANFYRLVWLRVATGQFLSTRHAARVRSVMSVSRCARIIESCVFCPRWSSPRRRVNFRHRSRCGSGLSDSRLCDDDSFVVSQNDPVGLEPDGITEWPCSSRPFC